MAATTYRKIISFHIFVQREEEETYAAGSGSSASTRGVKRDANVQWMLTGAAAALARLGRVCVVVANVLGQALMCGHTSVAAVASRPCEV
ncbi:hypothetical protein F2P81_022734 [Scophthalmus maximus]|uniref:Uncharacterized protein n=1 Tax=Scophthalmus maximus TaxID=52904 RepID=A0A6A4RV04_SCOMX|nr:hypothetical protein F2P81_022734 [Scophthalmus maximus]